MSLCANAIHRRADVIRVKQLVVEMLMDLVLVENVEYSTSVTETAMAPLMNIVSDTSDVRQPATVLLSLYNCYHVTTLSNHMFLRSLMSSLFYCHRPCDKRDGGTLLHPFHTLLVLRSHGRTLIKITFCSPVACTLSRLQVAATMLLKKDSIDLIKKLNEQFIAWDAEGVATGNTADIGFGSDTNAQHKTAVALFASIPKIGDFLVQMVRSH